MIDKNIFNLDLHEQIIINDNCSVMRVSGGWNYIYASGVQFVKYDSEFEFENVKTKLKPTKIFEVVKSYYGLSPVFPNISYGGGKYPLAKKICVNILTNYTPFSREDIRALLKYKSESSVNHAIRTLDDLIFSDKQIKKDYEFIIKELKL